MVSTNVPPLTWGTQGPQAPSEEAVFTGVMADIQGAFGGNLNPGLTTPQGQLATSLAAILGNVNDTFLFYANQVDPAFAVGRMQDAIGRIYFLEREPATPTTLQILCQGAIGTPIPAGFLIVDVADNDPIMCTGSGSITSPNGNIFPFQYVTPGPEPIPSGVQVFQAINGLDSVLVVGGSVGSFAETPAEFEQRRALSVAANSMGSLPSVLGAVLGVPGVNDAIAIENFLGTQVLNGTVTINPHSILVAVSGGSDAAVAQAIWTKKAPGCDMNGNTTVVVSDTISGYSPPLPTYNITFYRPSPLPVVMSINIVAGPNVPSDVVQQVQGTLLVAFAGGDGGPRARMGSIISPFRFVAPIVELGPWAQVSALGIGSKNNPDALFTGSIGGGVLNVTAMTSGTILIGDTIDTSGTMSGVVLPSTRIVSFGSGQGGIGTYNLNQSQTIGLNSLAAFGPNDPNVACSLLQEPTLSPSDIVVTVS